MSNKFKSGQKVTYAVSAMNGDERLSRGKEYTVKECTENYITLEEVSGSYHPTHFIAATTQTNIPTGCKPFNYEEAIKDLSKVVTRDWRVVSEMHKFETAGYTHNICAIIRGSFQWVNNEGVNSTYDINDLFLKDETVVYVNVYHAGISATVRDSIENAKDAATESAISICALTISNGEVIKTETVHKY